MVPGEQGGGTASTNGDATWVHRFFPNTRWSAPGGDFAAQPSASANAGFGAVTWTSTPALVADVQAWVDAPATNFGWILIGDESLPTTAKGWASREFSAPQRPTLTITYVPPAATVTSSGTGCAGTGSTPLVLAANGVPTLPNATFTLSATGGPGGPLAALSFALAVTPQPIPLGGNCFLFLDPGTLFAGVSFGPGRTLVLPVPSNMGLAGARFAAQAVVVDATVLSLATSNALEMRLGL